MQKNPLQSILNVIIVALMLLSGQVTFAQSSAPPWMGIVTYVTDGDTLWVQSIDHSTWHRLRILGIDAPEICQPWGSEARQTLTALVAGCQLEIIEFGLDVYGRWLGRLHIGSIDVGQWMVAQGHAWSYRYLNQSSPYKQQELIAKNLKRGSFALSKPKIPQSFRKKYGSCRLRHQVCVATHRALRIFFNL